MRQANLQMLLIKGLTNPGRSNMLSRGTWGRQGPTVDVDMHGSIGIIVQMVHVFSSQSNASSVETWRTSFPWHAERNMERRQSGLLDCLQLVEDIGASEVLHFSGAHMESCLLWQSCNRESVVMIPMACLQPQRWPTPDGRINRNKLLPATQCLVPVQLSPKGEPRGSAMMWPRAGREAECAGTTWPASRVHDDVE